MSKMRAAAWFLMLAVGAPATELGIRAAYWSSPKQALPHFYTFGSDPTKEAVTEDMDQYPLILTETRAVTLVLDEIQNRNMPKRGQAIGYLGNTRDRHALPILRRILDDATGSEWVRARALASIVMIDETLGAELAAPQVAQGGFLASVAKNVVENGTRWVEWHNYSEAFWSMLFIELGIG